MVRNSLRALFFNNRKIVITEGYHWDKYSTRIVGEVILEDNINVAELLVARHLGKKYDGGTKSKWTHEELKRIIEVLEQEKASLSTDIF